MPSSGTIRPPKPAPRAARDGAAPFGSEWMPDGAPLMARELPSAARAWLIRLRTALAGPPLDPRAEAEHQLFAARITGSCGQVLLVLTASLMLLLWPIDLLVLGNMPFELALLGGWRIAYAAIALSTARVTVRRTAQGRSPTRLLGGAIVTLAGGTYAVLGRIVPLESPWIHTAVVVPAFTLFILVPPLERLALVASTVGATWGAVVLTSGQAAAYAHWVEVGGVALLSVSFSFAFGHVGWIGARWYFVVRSARERAEAEQRRLEALVAQIQGARDTEALARGVSHEFNNLLHVILGSIDLIERSLPHDVPCRESFDDIRTAVQRGAQVCRQMSAYVGEAGLEVHTLDLAHVIRDQLPTISQTIPREVAFACEVPAEPLPIAGDPARLRGALDRLVCDALEAMRSTPKTIALEARRVVLSAELGEREPALLGLVPGPYAEIELRHSGESPRFDGQARWLDPVAVTGSTTRRLGLLVVVAIVRAHHGAILLDGAATTGTCIRVFLPLLSQAAAGMRAALPAQAGMSGTSA